MILKIKLSLENIFLKIFFFRIKTVNILIVNLMKNKPVYNSYQETQQTTKHKSLDVFENVKLYIP